MHGFSMPDDRYYHVDHYWLKPDGELLVMGMDDFAQKMAGEIVFVQLPFVGKRLNLGKKFAKVESGKWVGKILAPVNGEVAETNADLETHPKLINQDCYGTGWMYKIRPDDMGELENLIQGRAAMEKWLAADIEKYRK